MGFVVMTMHRISEPAAQAVHPSPLRILLVDFPATVLTCCLLVAWLAFAAWIRAGRLSAGNAGLAGFVTLLLALAIVCRIVWVWRILADGVEVEATVAWIERRWRRYSVRIDFVYRYQGEDFSASNRVGHTPRNLLAVDQRVTLRIDPRHPRRALIRDLYLR